MTKFVGTSRTGDTNANRVRLIQSRLNKLACGPLDIDGEFGPDTLRAVQLFQARSIDSMFRPLTIDGIVGPTTWAALFNISPSAVVTAPSSPLLAEVLQVADSQIGVTESPLGSNRGIEVDAYLRAVDINPTAGSFAWCAAFVYWCFERASAKLAIKNPCIQTAGVLDHWRKASESGVRRYTQDEAMAGDVVMPGYVFAIRTGPIHGHMGLVESVSQGILTTIEGNTNDGGGRDGIGVFRRTGRTVASINLGFIDYSSAGSVPL